MNHHMNRFIRPGGKWVLFLGMVVALATPRTTSAALFDINIFRYNQNSFNGGLVGTVPGSQAIPWGFIPLINAQIYAAMAPIGIAGIGFPPVGIAGIGFPPVGIAGIGFPPVGIAGIGFPPVGIAGIGLGLAGVPGYGIGAGIAGIPGLGFDPYLYGGMGLYGSGSYVATLTALARARLAMSMPMNYLTASYGVPMTMPMSYGALGVPAMGFPGVFGGFPVGMLTPSLAYGSYPQAGFGFPSMYGAFPVGGYPYSSYMGGYADPWLSIGYSPGGYPYTMPAYGGYPYTGYLPMGYGGY